MGHLSSPECFENKLKVVQTNAQQDNYLTADVKTPQKAIHIKEFG